MSANGLNWSRDVKPHIQHRLRQEAEKRTQAIRDAVASLQPGTARIIEGRVVQRDDNWFTVEGLSGVMYAYDVALLLDGQPARFEGRT